MYRKTLPLLYLVLTSCLFRQFCHCSFSTNHTKQNGKVKANFLTEMWQFLRSDDGAKDKVLGDDEDTLAHDPEATMNSIQIITNRGYPVESYPVITPDNYILELHRIPGAKGQASCKNSCGKPVFLQHGLLGSSADFLIGPSDRALAFRLADEGYDVWLGNSRGNTYSRKHKTLSPSKKAYWNFSWDEMGRMDIPAVLEFILSKTGKEKLIYIGYSMGCSMFFVAMATFPELGSKIEMMIGMAPAVSLAHMTSPVIRRIAPYVKQVESMFNFLRIRAFLPNDSPINHLKRRFCRRNRLRAGICRNMLFLLVGDDAENLELDLLPVINGNTPAGTSVRTVAQFAMNLNSGQTFIPYNHGYLGNYLRYRKFRPPPYDLTKVTPRIYLFYGANDLLVREKDVKWLANQLPNLQDVILVESDTYNHVNFLWGKNNNQLIYDKLISLLPSPK